jgi:N,N'-diacetyllegionaminate synthase
MAHKTFSIGGKTVGPGSPAFLVAEIAQAHDGSLGLAHAFIDAAAEAGADAIKFQTHIAAGESTVDEPFRVRFSRQDATRYQYWKRMEFSAEGWRGLAEHASEKGLAFLSSPFSVEALELLESLQVPAWKVASGELGSDAMLDAMLRTAKPMIVSTGMSPWKEIDRVAEQVGRAGAALCLLQCTTRYPTPLEATGLNVIEELRRRYGCAAGLSDHSGTVYPALAAIARGANLIELHLTLDRRMFGPDVSSSLTVEEFRTVSKARDAFRRMDEHPVDKDAVAAELAGMRELFMRSAAPTRPLKAGTVLTADMLAAKKPGTGIPASRIPSLVGRKLRREVLPDRLLKEDDFE